MSLEFLSPSSDAVARSPMERQAEAAGARFELREGWNVAVSYPGEASSAAVVFADSSHLRKVEVHGAQGLELGTAERRYLNDIFAELCAIASPSLRIVHRARGRYRPWYQRTPTQASA